LVIVVGGAAVLVVALNNRQADAGWRELYRIDSVESIVFTETVEITGNLRPVDVRDLSFPTGGRVIEVSVEVGTEVAAGSVVARLDDLRARYELATVEKLLQQKQLTGSSREIELLQLERQLRAQAVQDHILSSPISGRVSQVDVRVDEQVSAGRRIARVIDDSAFKAIVQIDEIDSPRVRTGQTVQFFFDALPQLDVAGTVHSLALESRTTAEGLTVRDVEVLTENPPAELLSGYSFTGQILLDAEETVLAIPEEAIFNQRGETFVLLPPQNGDGPEKQVVEARILDSKRISILAGLTAGQQILVPLYSETGGWQRSRLSTEGLIDSLRERSRIPFVRGDR